MSHSIARSVPSLPPAAGGSAGPLTLDDTTRTEWDIVMTRDDRWVTCRSGITDAAEVAQELQWFSLGNPSGSVTYRVLERTVTLRERLLDGPPPAPGDPGGAIAQEALSAPVVDVLFGLPANRSDGPPGARLAGSPVGPPTQAASAHDLEVPPAGGTDGNGVEPATSAPSALGSRVTVHDSDPLTARCKTCRAAPGTPCRTPSGKPAVRPHLPRAYDAQQLYFDDVAKARQRGISVQQLHTQRQALQQARDQALAQARVLNQERER